MKSSKQELERIFCGVNIRKDSSQGLNHIHAGNWVNEIESSIFKTAVSYNKELVLLPKIKFSLEPEKYLHLFEDYDLRECLTRILSEDFLHSILPSTITHNRKVLGQIRELVNTLDESGCVQHINKEYINDYIQFMILKQNTLRINKISISGYHYTFEIEVKIAGSDSVWDRPFRKIFVIHKETDLQPSELLELTQQEIKQELSKI